MLQHSEKLKIYRIGNSTIFFSHAGTGKDFEELFTLTLNGIVVSVWYVSSTPVVLHAKLNDQLRRRNKMFRQHEMKKTEDSDSFSQAEYRH